MKIRVAPSTPSFRGITMINGRRRPCLLWSVGLSAVLMTAAGIARADVIYDISMSGGGETITGSISISCTPTCTLEPSNVTAWNFIGTGPTPLDISSSDPGATDQVNTFDGPSDLVAFASQLTAIQNATAPPGGANFIFQDPLVTGLSEVTFNDEALGGIEVDAYNAGDTTVATSFFLYVDTAAPTYIPIGTPVPEPASLSFLGSGLALLGLAGIHRAAQGKRQRRTAPE